MRPYRPAESMREPSSLKKAWDLCWGLLLVVALTLLSEAGMHLGYSKSPAGQSAATAGQPAAPLVK